MLEGQGKAVKQLRGIYIYKNKMVILCLFLFNNDVDLKNNTRNHGKPV